MKRKKKSPNKKSSTDARKKTSQKENKFITQLSHGFRNSLNAIIGFSELLSTKQAGEINRKQKEYLNDIVSSAKDLLNFLQKATVKGSQKAKPSSKKKKSKKKRS